MRLAWDGYLNGCDVGGLPSADGRRVRSARFSDRTAITG
ncbi:hypothetical protein SAMN04489729_2965 [Amycolatopsis lurida]|nr:hypothetical protein SAMN04489729_2965 [Amycolatopsis lurida]